MYDPFVGTGSLLVGAAALGAATLGADMDIRIVREGELCSHQWPLWQCLAHCWYTVVSHEVGLGYVSAASSLQGASRRPTASSLSGVCFACPAGKVSKAGQSVNIWSNFDAYKLQPPAGILRADAHRPPFRHDLEVSNSGL